MSSLAAFGRKLFRAIVASGELVDGPAKAKDDNKPYPVIIGAGFGRTGTSSIREGLNELGYKCYHMRETFTQKTGIHPKTWIFLYEEKMKLQKEKNIKSFDRWNEITLDYETYGQYFEFILDDSGYTASVDWPACIFYLELIEYYKRKGVNFKVLLSIRDSGEQWFRSYSQTIGAMPDMMSHWLWSLIPGMKHSMTLTKIVFKPTFEDDKRKQEKYMVNKYNQWIDSVKKFVDKDDLIIFNVKQGWNPLIKPLKLEIPKEYADKPDEFIRSNESKQLKKTMKRVQCIQMFANIVAIFIVCVILFFVFRMFV